MLSASPLPNPDVAHHYFERDDYYVKGEGLSPSAWWGEGARRLGLSGEVDRETFGKLLRGEMPDGSTLIGRGGDQADRRPGLDLTFSAPKTVSLLALVHGDEAVSTAHDRAVTEALSHLEREAAWARMTVGGRTAPEATKNLVVARFVHHTSRELDPQLHTHAVVLNVTQRADGEWRAITNEELFRQKMLGGVIYRAALARELRAIGYDIERTHADGRFEVKGFSKEQIAGFSKRRAEIEAVLEARQATGAKEAERAALLSRKGKQEVDRSLLRDLWREEAETLGVRWPEKVMSLARRTERPSITARDAVLRALEHVTERKAIFTERELLVESLRRSIGAADHQSVEAAVRDLSRAQEIIPAKKDHLGQDLARRWTTKKALAMETGIVALVRLGRNREEPILERTDVEARLVGRGLTEGQERAVALILSATDRVVGIQGYAGTGKTTALSLVRELAEQQGYAVRGFAPSASAAEALREGASIESETLARHLKALEHDGHRSAKRQIWIVDETSLVGNRDALRFLRAAHDRGARVVLVGDKDQLPSISAGKVFALIQEHKEIAVERMTEILRQQDKHLLGAVTRTIAKQNREALRHLASFVRVVPDREARLARVAEAYLSEDDSKRRRTIVVTPSNRDRRDINVLIREGLKGEGALGDRDTEATILVPRHLTTAETKDASHYRVGDVVRFRGSYKSLGVEKGDYFCVVEVDEARKTIVLTDGRDRIDWAPHRHAKVEVYESDCRPLADGDMIRWTRNDHRNHRRNGETAMVLEVDEEARTASVLVGGRRQTLDLDRDLHWDHGYVSTVHAAQGRTADRAILHIDTSESRLTGHESWYVSVSRARHGVEILTDDEARLPVVITRSMAKESALEEVVRGRFAEDEPHFEASHSVAPRERVRGPGPRPHERDPREAVLAGGERNITDERGPRERGAWDRTR